MNINTPYFRAALTIAAIWIVVFAYLAYSDYRKAYRSIDYAIYSVPEEETYQCSSQVLEVTNQDFQWREQTIKEQSECYSRLAQEQRGLIRSGNRLALEQAWKSFGWKGALPALLLLAVVGFWTFIFTNISRAGLGYFNWLRFGSIKSNSASTDNEP